MAVRFVYVAIGFANCNRHFDNIDIADGRLIAIVLPSNYSMKPFANLTPKDIRNHPVWEFCNDLEAELADETIVRPVFDLPVDDLRNRVVGTKLRFANGDSVDGILSNIDLHNHTQTEHFVALTLYGKDGTMFHLARYHDISADTHGPVACAAYFGLAIADMFPIAYNIDSVAIGVPDSVCLQIPAHPKQRLDEDELMRMALSG